MTNLSLSTISKYMNGGNVLDKNKKLIDKAIKELNYKTNQFARSLKTNKSNTVGVIIPELNSSFNTSIIARVSEILRQHGYGVLICDSKLSSKGEEEALEFLMSKQVDGIITIPFDITGKHLLKARRDNIPVVLIDRLTEEIEADAVIVNNREASKNAVCQIIKKKHTRIGIILGSDDIYTMNERKKGYIDALVENGIEVDDDLIQTESISLMGGYEGLKSIVEKPNPPTALFIANYYFSLGVIIAMNELGIRIGKDLSIIAFDNMELARVIKPKLTIIAQPMEEMANEAASLMLKRLTNTKKSPYKVIVLDTIFEKGNSVRSNAKQCNP